MKKNKVIVGLFISLLIVSINLYSQSHDKISFGLNITHFKDWKNKPINFFNPEIRYLKPLNPNNAIDIGINSFYAQAESQDFLNPGDVFQRLIFSIDVGFKQYFNHFSANIGPSLRYRNEKIRVSCTSCPLWEFRIEPKKGFVDFGGVAGLNYELFIKEKSSFEIRMTYRLYNKGVNPISLGLFYNRRI